MKNIDNFIQEKLKVNSKSKVNQYNYFPKTNEELIQIIYRLIQERGEDCDLNDIDVSEITDMESVFDDNDIVRSFNGDISKWDVSNVECMNFMFAHSKFNGDISEWNVSKARLMNGMFAYSNFNQNIDNWTPPKNFKYNLIFQHCPLEKNPPKWYGKNS